MILLVLAIGVGVAVRFLANSSTTEKEPPRTTPTISQAATDAQDVASSGDVTKSNDILAQELARPSISSKDKYDAYLQLGINVLNSTQPANHQAALEYFMQAEVAQQSYEVSHLIGEQYEAMGNTAKAIEYYKKTLTQLDKNNPGYFMNKEDYETRIKNLGGTP